MSEKKRAVRERPVLPRRLADAGAGAAVPPELLARPSAADVAAVAPPVVTRAQELPLNELGWENFERLCVALFMAEEGVADCRMHGRQGSWQGGIDLLVSRRDGGTTAVQCKRVKAFGGADVTRVVAEFLRGPWRARVDEFHLCTSHDLRLVTEAVEKARRKLYAHEISFTVLDAPMLSRRLKAHPRLVADFFGVPWEEALCGGRSAAAAAAAPAAEEPWRDMLDAVLGQPPELRWAAAAERQPNNLRFPRNANFRGRAAELEKVHALLRRGAAVAVTQAVAVHGLGGIGKTQVANEYAWRFASQYSALLWVPADSPGEVFRGLAALASSGVLGRPAAGMADGSKVTGEALAAWPVTALAAAALEWLAAHHDWLLIFDNADTPDVGDLLTALLPRLRQGHVMVTSRRSVWHESFGMCALGVLTLGEAVGFLLDRCPAAGDEALASRLARRLGCLPLALAQAAACIHVEGLSFAQYLMELRGSSRLETLRRLPAGALSYPRPVAETWALTLARLDQPAVTLLQILAWFAPDKISRSLVEGRVKMDEDSRPVSCRKVLVQLAEYSLVELGPRDIAMHRLLQAVVQDSMPAEKRPHWLGMALQIIAGLSSTHFGEDDVREWRTWETLAPHAMEVLEHAQRHGMMVEEVTEIGHRLTRHLLARSRYAEALPLACRVVAFMRQRFGRGHQHVATALGTVASALADCGHPEKALRVHRQALEIDRRACGPRSEAVAVDLSGIGICLLDMGRHQEAEPILRRAVELSSHHLAKDDPNFLTARLNLAGVLRDNGKGKEAAAIYREVLRITERRFGPTHPEVCTVLNGLALTWLDLRQPRKAGPCITRALRIARRRLGRTHALVPLFMNTAARVSHALGDLPGAAGWQKKSLALCEEIHGPEHPSTLSSLGNLASLHADMGRLHEARRCFEEVARREEHVFGPDDPRLAARLSNLADLHHREHRLEEAEALYRRVVAMDETAHGPAHLEVAEDLRHLAQVLADSGRHEESKAALKRALKIYRAHPGGKSDGRQRARALHDCL